MDRHDGFAQQINLMGPLNSLIEPGIHGLAATIYVSFRRTEKYEKLRVLARNVGYTEH
jgi:hypothetical protein